MNRSTNQLNIPHDESKRICVLEDDRGISEVVEMFLFSEDYEVVSFFNISTMFNSCCGRIANLFLLNVMLSDGNDFDLCTQLKAYPKTAEIPMLMMSAHGKLPELKDRCQPHGFISKPFDIDDLVKKNWNAFL